MMTKRVLGGFLVGMLLLAGPGLAQEAVELPPAEAEVAALEDAFAQLTGLFRGLILEIRGSLTMLGKRVEDLERSSLVFQMGLEGLGERILGHERQLTGLAGRLTTVERSIEGTIGPKVVELDGRIGALEKHDFASLERRLAALDKAREALSIRIDHNRAKIEALEVALVAVNAATEERLAVAAEAQEAAAAAQRQEIETLQSELARVAQAQQAQWSAIFLVPIVVGGLLYLLLAQSG